MNVEQQAAVAQPTALMSDHQLLRELERRCAADGVAYAVERYVPCPEQRAQYIARAVALLTASRWEQRNLGVKLLGVLQAAGEYRALVQKIEDRTPATFLARCFGGDFREVGFIRRNAVAALSRLGIVNEAVEGALVAALGDPYYEVRAEAARAIIQLAPRLRSRRADLAAALERCTHDRSIEVATAACEALGAAGDRSHALPALLALAEARFWKVRAAALTGLLALVERGEGDDLDALEQRIRRFVLTSTDFQPQFQIKRTYGQLLTAIAAQKDAIR